MSYFSNFPKILYSTALGVKNYKIVPNILAKTIFRSDIFNNSSIYYPYSVKDGEKPEDIAAKLYGDETKHWIILLSNNIVDPQYDWVLSTSAFNDYILKKYSSIQFTFNPLDAYPINYIVGEKVYQGTSFDRASCYANVVEYDSVNKKLRVNFASDVFANNTTITGATSNASHASVGAITALDGFEWSSNTTSHYKVSEVISNSYDRTKTERTYRVSVKDYNHATDALIDRNVNTSSTFTYTIDGGVTLTIQRTTAPVTYYDYELELNEEKRQIKLIKPEYVPRIESEFKKLMSS